MNIINGIEEVHQLTTELTIINNQQNNRQQALDINSETTSIKQFLQEHEQMLRSSQDPQVFNYSEDLNNNLELGDILDLNNSNFLSQNFEPGDFDMYNEFFGTTNFMERKELETQSLSPLPAPSVISNPPSPCAPNVTEQPQQQNPRLDSIVKLEGELMGDDFDLVDYMEVSYHYN